MTNQAVWLSAITLLMLSGSWQPGHTREQTQTDDQTVNQELVEAPFVNIGIALPDHFPAPGGIAIVPLELTGPDKPVARFGSRDLLVIPYRNQWHAVVGLGCNIIPGNYILGTVDAEDETGMVTMRVGTLPPPAAANSTVEITPRRLASPLQLPDDLQSSILDNPAMAIPQELLSYQSEIEPTFVFAPVTESVRVIPYGKIRRQNRIVTHDYLSYIAKADTQVYAPAAGVVIKVVESDTNGISVFLDHGGGILSLLGNLQKALVQEGQVLDSGEQIGRAAADGALGRSRIDFAIGLNGFLVDPLQFPASS